MLFYKLRTGKSFQMYSEVMGALASVLTIWIITGILVYLAVMRIMENK